MCSIHGLMETLEEVTFSLFENATEIGFMLVRRE